MEHAETYQDHERLIMLALQPMIRELLLVEVADLIAFLTFDQHNQVTDIVDSAVEQFYAPGFIGYRESGYVEVDWNRTPTVQLEMTLNAPSFAFEFSLILDSKAASVKLLNINQLASHKAATHEETLNSLKRAIDVNSVKVEQV